MTQTSGPSGDGPKKKRTYVSQSDVPRLPLEDALRIAAAIADNYAKQPTKPLRVAEAMGMSPSSGTFRNLTSASAAYGLTTGTAWAGEIGLAELGRRIVAPTEEGDDLLARREAVLQPRVVRDFLQKYNNSKMPVDRIALNVLEEMGVPADACARTLSIIRTNAEALGLLREIKGQQYVDLQGIESLGTDEPEEKSDLIPKAESLSHPAREGEKTSIPSRVTPVALAENRRVFITHGKNTGIVQQLKELLHFGSFEPVVSIETETVAKPVPDKVLEDMRGCSAAIVHVGSERKVIDENGDPQVIVNPNVLIEIGAAMALYGRRFILLVEKGVDLPSNLQGLYEVRYEGSKLDYDATMKLLKAFNDFKAAAEST